MQSPIGTLYLEEVKATMRGRFAWLGAAVLLLAVGGLATVATQDTWLDGYGIIAYFLVPLAFIPFAAGAIASPRVNRFVESVFTAPVERRNWLTAKVLVLLTLATAYYLALIPMMLVYIHDVGMPFLLKKFLIWAPGILIASTAIGILIGVLFIGRSIAAPAATGMGILLAYAGLVPLQELMVARGSGATRMGRVALVSPAVLLKNALGFTLVAGNIPMTTTRTWISLAVVVIGAFVLAVWVFLRAQGVETWETTRRQRSTIALVIAALFLFPALFARGSSSLALASPGGHLPARCCSTILNRDAAPFGTDESTRQDLFILLPVDARENVTDLRIQVAGNDGLHVTADPNAIAFAADHLEPHTYANDLGPAASDGHRVVSGWVARIPVTLRPTNPWDIGGNRYPLDVTATYHIAGDSQTRTVSGRGAIEAEISSGIYEMGAASAILPLICLGAALMRWRRTR
jgi:ABC-type transport system involved in multi-copper enzyme maturation permease subunit